MILVKDQKGDVLADSPSMFNGWKNCICQLMNVHGVNNVKQTKIHTAELLVHKPRASEIEMATEKLRRCKSCGTDQVPAELIQA